MNWTDFLWAIPAYFLGSIPTAVWVGRAKYNLDVREHGSKNAGATNTFRVLGKKAGRVVLNIVILKLITLNLAVQTLEATNFYMQHNCINTIFADLKKSKNAT